MRHIVRIIPLVVLFFGLILAVHRYGTQDLLTVVLSLTVIAPVVYLIMDRQAQQNQLQHMKEEALRAELALLKSQIDPHFFFNTLNNLYGLAVAKSDDAPRMILKLSELMRFTIYEGRKEQVLLRDEIAYLQNYLALQRIRTHLTPETLRCDIDVADDLVSLPPLLLIMLVENAVKHGLARTLERPFVHLQLSADAHHLSFRIANRYDPEARPGRGIGLANLTRRLTLLYPGRHHYAAEAADGVYTAHLRLDL